MSHSKKFRNIAIIAHIDHGKTTLLDCLLKQSNLFRDNEMVVERMMDSYDQERERGITIFAKHTSIPFGDYKINIIDTPGHADFSGEVERVLGMVNCVLLIIDAQDGPMPQTRFVLSKALKLGLKPIVVVNKVDRPQSNPHAALDKTFDLFVELGATDQQLDFRHCFTSALTGFAIQELGDERVDMRPLFELIIDAVPPPPDDETAPFLMQAMTLGYDDYVGRQATGRILGGSVKKGQSVLRLDAKGTKKNYNITRVEGWRGLKKVEMDIAFAGDIVTLSGIEEANLGDTICDPSNVRQLPAIQLDEPTMSINVMINNSAFAGKEGKNVTFNKIRERLERERRQNISLRIEDYEGEGEAITVCGRGELHLSVLLEAMRREAFEMTISKPKVILKMIDGVRHEPVEKVYIEVPQDYAGSVIEELSKRKGEMQHLSTNEHNITSLEFLIPTRGLSGYRNEFLTVTRGLGILTSIFDSYQPWKGEIPKRQNGVMISMNTGKVTTYAIGGLQDRGILFVNPGDEVYEGMESHCRR